MTFRIAWGPALRAFPDGRRFAPSRLADYGFDVSRGREPEDLVRGLARSSQQPERDLYCFICGTAITHDRERFAVQGSHEHTFTNPAGYVYRIGCFRAAPGCLETGEFTEAYTWFTGCAWRYALCSSCRVHLGWAYRGNEEERFYGLILDRLVDSREHFPSTS